MTCRRVTEYQEKEKMILLPHYLGSNSLYLKGFLLSNHIYTPHITPRSAPLW